MGVAHNVLGSFVSRNNHVDGYWAIGKLYKLIKSTKSDRIVVDLINGTITPNAPEFQEMAQRNAQKLQEQLKTWKIKPLQVISAEIEFKVDISKTKRHRNFPGQKFKRYSCGLVITDNRGVEHCDITYGWCFPHHPNMEKRAGEEEE